MTHASLTIILREHRALSAMLRKITLLLDRHKRQNTLPDFGALHAMLFRLEEFQEELQPNERCLLFRSLRGHDASTDAVLERLERDHAREGRSIRELEKALASFEMMSDTDQCDARRKKFETSMTQYVDRCHEHMHIEENEVLPLAEMVLLPQDRPALDAASLGNTSRRDRSH